MVPMASNFWKPPTFSRRNGFRITPSATLPRESNLQVSCCTERIEFQTNVSKHKQLSRFHVICGHILLACISMQNHRRLWSKHFSSLAIQGPPFCPCPSPSICTFTYLYSFIIREGKNLNFTALNTVATYTKVRKEQKNPKQTKNKHHTHVPIQQGITKESKEHHIAELFTC